jgi:hypothetical protein
VIVPALLTATATTTNGFFERRLSLITRKINTRRAKSISICLVFFNSLGAVGYTHDAVRIFCDKNGKVTQVPYVERVARRCRTVA